MRDPTEGKWFGEWMMDNTYFIYKHTGVHCDVKLCK